MTESLEVENVNVPRTAVVRYGDAAIVAILAPDKALVNVAADAHRQHHDHALAIGHVLTIDNVLRHSG